MADDIDDLLDEVETKFCENNQSNSRQYTTGSRHKRTQNSKNRSCLDDDIDQILNDVDDKLDKITCTEKKHGDASSNQSRPESAKRCFPIYLGGTSFLMGQGSTFSKKTCDKLRCTSCDFRVISFDNFKWNNNTDYLFLRNNVPDFQKLKSNLVSKKGRIAVSAAGSPSKILRNSSTLSSSGCVGSTPDQAPMIQIHTGVVQHFHKSTCNNLFWFVTPPDPERPHQKTFVVYTFELNVI